LVAKCGRTTQPCRAGLGKWLALRAECLVSNRLCRMAYVDPDHCRLPPTHDDANRRGIAACVAMCPTPHDHAATPAPMRTSRRRSASQITRPQTFMPGRRMTTTGQRPGHLPSLARRARKQCPPNHQGQRSGHLSHPHRQRTRPFHFPEFPLGRQTPWNCIVNPHLATGSSSVAAVCVNRRWCEFLGV